MKKGNNRNKKSSAAKELKCIKVPAMLCSEYMWMAHANYAEAAARLGQIAQDEKHLAELLDALDYEIGQRRVPLDERGSDLLKRFGRGPLPDVD